MKNKRRMKGNRLLALLLTVTMIATSQGLPTLAETVRAEVSDAKMMTVSGINEELTGQEMTEECAEENAESEEKETVSGGTKESEQSEEGEKAQEPGEPEETETGMSEQLELEEITGQGEAGQPKTEEITEPELTIDTEELTEEPEIKADSTSPANPVHHCTKQDDGSDYTDWSYVYFGSYPQSEVTGDALTTAITGAAYDDNGDAWVNGTKYRRISKSDTNYDGYFGDSTYRYFKWERIKWRVLQNDGNTLFLMADKGLDCKDYHDPGGSITWEDCTLRQWLNNDFYGTAFSSAEQGAIVEQMVLNEDNPYGPEGGNNTNDRVYLLSIGEVANSSYGFCEDYNTYSGSRWVQPSSFACTRGAFSASYYINDNRTSNWWLRSPGSNTYYAARGAHDGRVDRCGTYVNYGSDVVVPVLHINLSSSLWSLTDDGTSGSGGNGGAGDDSSSIDPGSATVSCDSSKTLNVGREALLFFNIHGANKSEINGAMNTMTFTSSNESVLTINKGSSINGYSSGNGTIEDAFCMVRLYGKKAGVSKVTCTLGNGNTASCSVKVVTAEEKKPIPVTSTDPSEVAEAVVFSMEDYVADITGEDATIYGPTLDVLDKQFSLFQLDVSTEISTDKLKTEVSYDAENKLVKVLIGVSTSGEAGIDGTADNRTHNDAWVKEYNQFKDLYKQMTKSTGNGISWNQYQKLKGKMNEFQCKLMVDANMWASGYMEWSYESGELKFSEGGFIEQAELSAKVKQNIPQIPLCYWFIDVTADEKGNFIFRQAGEMIVTDFSLTPSLGAEIGLGMGKSEGKFQTYLEGSMEGVLSATIANKDPKLKVVLDGSLHARGYAIGHELLDETYSFPQWQIYPGEESRAEMKMAPLQIGDVTTVYEEAAVLSRDYLLSEETDMKLSSEDGTETEYLYEQNGVFPYCEPHLFALSGGRLLLLMVGDDGSKSANNRTSLMYTIYDGGNWSSLKKIAEDGTYVDGIVAKQEGDNVYVTFRKANQTFSDEAALEEMVAALDLYEVTFDGTAFGTPISVNGTGNGVLESGQTMYVKDGVLTVAWLENSENDIFLSSGTNSLHMKTLANGIWSEETTVKETTDVISEIAAGSLNGKVSLVYGVQKSGDAENVTVYQYTDGTEKQILAEYPQACEYTLQGEKLYFLNQESLYRFDGTAAVEESISGISNYQILENGGAKMLLANVPNGAGSELYLSEADGDNWGEFRQFTSQEGYIRNYSAVLSGGEVKTAINRLEVDSEGNFGIAALLVTEEDEVYDLAADYVYYEDTKVTPGENLPLEIGMTNLGKNNISKVTVMVKDEDGAVLLTKDVEAVIAAGEQKIVTMELPLTQQLMKRKITVELSVPQKELTTENNTVSTEIHYIDLMAAQASCSMTAEGELLITGTLVNKGLEDITNVRTGIYFSILTGEKLDEIVTDTIKAGETVTFQSVLPGDMMYQDDTVQLNALMIYAESDSEERNYANNELRIVFDAKGQQLNSGKNQDESGGENQNPGNNPNPGGDSGSGNDGNTTGGNEQNPGDTGDNSGGSQNPGDNSGNNQNAGNTGNGESGENGNASGDNGEGTTVRTQRITISAPSKKIAAGKKVQLTAKITPKNVTNPNVTWKSSNKKYATVNSKGVVTTKKAGKGKTVTITATAKDGSGKKASVKIKIMKNAVTKVKIKNAPKTLKVKKSITLKTAVSTNGSNANKTLKWTSSNSKYATVTSKGKVTAKKAGKGKTVTITAMSTDGTNKKAKVKIKIK